MLISTMKPVTSIIVNNVCEERLKIASLLTYVVDRIQALLRVSKQD